MNTFVQQGDKIILDLLAADPLVYLKLFANDRVPLVTDTEANYTEATFSGYPGSTAITWSAAFVNGSAKGEIDGDPVDFTNSTGAVGNTIYGAYVVDGSGKLIYADRFGAPFVMTAAGATFSYTPVVTAVTG